MKIQIINQIAGQEPNNKILVSHTHTSEQWRRKNSIKTTTEQHGQKVFVFEKKTHEIGHVVPEYKSHI